MPNEPERLLEKLLRDCAKKRGEETGAGMVLHPANRRLLQEEVARRYGRRGLRRSGFWIGAVLRRSSEENQPP